jgi:hypothetical protein
VHSTLPVSWLSSRWAAFSSSSSAVIREVEALFGEHFGELEADAAGCPRHHCKRALLLVIHHWLPSLAV